MENSRKRLTLARAVLTSLTACTLARAEKREVDNGIGSWKGGLDYER